MIVLDCSTETLGVHNMAKETEAQQELKFECSTYFLSESLLVPLSDLISNISGLF